MAHSVYTASSSCLMLLMQRRHSSCALIPSSTGVRKNGRMCDYLGTTDGESQELLQGT